MPGTLKVTTPSDLEIVMTRVFDAPRQLVWDAMSKTELLKRWVHGFTGSELVACENDHRAGGRYRFAWRGRDGQEMSMHGVYREVVPPAPNGQGGLIVRTETMEFGGRSHGELGEKLGTLRLTDQGDRTLLTFTVLFPSRDARDAAVNAGINQGVASGLNSLDEFLAASIA